MVYIYDVYYIHGLYYILNDIYDIDIYIYILYLYIYDISYSNI